MTRLQTNVTGVPALAACGSEHRLPEVGELAYLHADVRAPCLLEPGLAHLVRGRCRDHVPHRLDVRVEVARSDVVLEVGADAGDAHAHAGCLGFRHGHGPAHAVDV